MDFSKELSTPVESLLQPGLVDTWWLEGNGMSGDYNNDSPGIRCSCRSCNDTSSEMIGPTTMTTVSLVPLSAPASVQSTDSTVDLISPQYLMSSGQDLRSVTAPPTPGLSLLEQLHMDQPLMEVISNKHKRGYYRCTHCPKTFSSIFEYASHMDEFDIRREFKCPFALCPWKILGLPRRPDLRRHCAIQHKDHLPADLKEMLNLKDEAYPTLQCPHQYCDKIFHRKDAYNRHIAIVHEKMGSRFNKRMFQILADCPFDKEPERQRYVRTRMKSRRNSAGGQNGGGVGGVHKQSRRHSIAIAGIR